MGECRSTWLDERQWLQRQEHRETGIAVEGLIGGVATMGGRMREGMVQKTGEDRDACSVLRPCDV